MVSPFRLQFREGFFCRTVLIMHLPDNEVYIQAPNFCYEKDASKMVYILLHDNKSSCDCNINILNLIGMDYRYIGIMYEYAPKSWTVNRTVLSGMLLALSTWLTKE